MKKKLIKIAVFIATRQKAYSVSEISEKLRFPSQTVFNYVKELEKTGFVKRKIRHKGKSRFFFVWNKKST